MLIEVGTHVETVLIPRLKKAVFSPEWNDGTPVRCPSETESKAVSGVIKCVSLESYEDALGNLTLQRSGRQKTLLESNDEIREDYLLNYALEVESRGSQSLLNVDSFRCPDSYELRVERNGETQLVSVDLVETFNWLLGLTVKHIDVIRSIRVVDGQAK